MPSMHQATHGHYSPQTLAPRRFPCPGCGRITAVIQIAGYLAVHDRKNLATGMRELCPGSRSTPKADA